MPTSRLRFALALSVACSPAVLYPEAASAAEAAPAERPPTAAPPADEPRDRWSGFVAAGSTPLVNVDSPILLGGRFGAGRWMKNVFISAGAEGAAMGKSFVAGVDLGVRVVGSRGPIGPYVGAGLGFLHLDLKSDAGDRFRGSNDGFATYAELGVVAGIVFAGVRATLPLFGVRGTVDAGTSPSGAALTSATYARPIPITAQLGIGF